MARYEITGPDGAKWEIKAPDDATEDAVMAYAQQQWVAQQKPADAPAPVGGAPEPLTRTEKVLEGALDPISGGAQLLTHILPESVVKKGNEFNNWLADKTGLVGRLPEGGIDQQIAEREAAYQARRQAAGESGIDAYRMLGNMLSPANLAVGASSVRLLPQAASLVGKMASGAATGTAYGAMMPVASGDFWGEKAKQGGLGAVAGAAVPAVAEGVARVIRPIVDPAVKTLRDAGVTPTIGQIMGGRWQVAEDKLTSFPLIGDAIASARRKSLDEFNRGVYDRALSPISGQAPKAVGREGVAAVRQQIGQAYDDLLPKLQFKADPQFKAELTNLQQMASALPEQQAKRFEKVLETQIVGKMTPQGNMSGETLKAVESELGKLSKGYRGDQSFDNRQLGDAIAELQNIVRQNLTRSNPEHAAQLAKINNAFANYARIRDAASRQGAQEGRFTPAQLSAAVRAQDKTVGKRAFSEGSALMQDLSDAGKSVLSQSYPDSGTAGRIALGGLTAGGGYMVSPGALLGGLTAMTPYLPGGRQAAAALLTSRPQFAEPLANAVRKYLPAVTPGLIPVSELNQ